MIKTENLILTFNKEQLKLYNELLKCDSVSLSFDTELPRLNALADCGFNALASASEDEAKRLLAFKKYGASFSLFFTKEEIQEFIPLYYDVIRAIGKYKEALNADILLLSKELSKSREICVDIYERYSSFLPYKAALYSRGEYASAISEADAKFKESIERSELYREELYERLQKTEALYGIVCEFCQTTSRASDEPKFQKFDACALLGAAEAFIKRLKAIK